MTEALIKTAGSFSAEDIERLRAGFEKMLGKELVFKVENDPALIGGFVAYIDGRVYDAGIKTQLRRVASGFAEK